MFLSKEQSKLAKIYRSDEQHKAMHFLPNISDVTVEQLNNAILAPFMQNIME